MKFTDVYEKNIYVADFDPVKKCEFNGQHLALVLKKNVDKRTATVVPLTRSSNGEGINKWNLGKILTLPSNLRNDYSYVVYNQVRVVNVSRLRSLKDDLGNKLNAILNDGLFDKVIELCSEEISDLFSEEKKLKYYYQKHVKIVVEKVVNIAYDIKRVLDSDNEYEEKVNQIKGFQTQIISILNVDVDLEEYIDDIDKENGIIVIIKRCLENIIMDIIQVESEGIA